MRLFKHMLYAIARFIYLLLIIFSLFNIFVVVQAVLIHKQALYTYKLMLPLVKQSKFNRIKLKYKAFNKIWSTVLYTDNKYVKYNV